MVAQVPTLFEKFEPILSHCHSVTSFLATSQLPSCPLNSLESCCGAGRWRSWPFPTLQLPRLAFPFCHQVTKAAADWDITDRPGKRYSDEGTLSHPRSFLALYCWGLCFIESQPWHTLLGEVDMFPVEELCSWPYPGPAHTSASGSHPCGSLALTYAHMAPSSRALALCFSCLPGV